MNTERIKEIQQETAYPDSVSVQQALLKVWNECEQEKVVKNNAALPHVSGSLFPDEDWISKNAPLNPDATNEDVLIHNWWIGGAKDYRDEILRRLQQ